MRLAVMKTARRGVILFPPRVRSAYRACREQSNALSKPYRSETYARINLNNKKEKHV